MCLMEDCVALPVQLPMSFITLSKLVHPPPSVVKYLQLVRQVNFMMVPAANPVALKIAPVAISTQNKMLLSVVGVKLVSP